MSVESPTFNTQEIDQTPDVEKIMACPWGSFDQGVMLRRHTRANGKVITKGFGVSIAYMPGVTSEMREDVMKKTLNIENPYIERWAGEQQGEIFCMSKDLDQAPDVYQFIRGLIQNSGDVVDDRHPYRKHDRVERFLSVQQDRLDFASTVAEDAQRILDTPEFTGWSSMNPKYEGAGKVYLIEFIVEEDGILYGSCPDGSKRPVSELAIDESHNRWINKGLIPMFTRPMLFPEGYRIGGDGEDTETVSGCGIEDEEYRGSCSDFFDLMENRVITTSSNITLQSNSISYETSSSTEGYVKVVDTLGREFTMCTECRKEKGNCNCSKEAKKES